MGLDQYAHFRHKDDKGSNSYTIESWMDLSYDEDDDEYLHGFLKDVKDKKDFRWSIDYMTKPPLLGEYIHFRFHNSSEVLLCKVMSINEMKDDDENDGIRFSHKVILRPIERGNTGEAHYWRKNHTLQNWMRERWALNIGDKEEFNCIEFQLYKDDIDTLKTNIINGDSEMGEPHYKDSGHKKYDLEFVEGALKALKNGRKVIYDSSW